MKKTYLKLKHILKWKVVMSFSRIWSIIRPDAAKFSEMQHSKYQKEAPRMAKVNHVQHNSNPDLWQIGYGPLILFPERFQGGLALDFACGAGRNMENLNKFSIFSQIHGCDISKENLEFAKKNLEEFAPKGNFKFFPVDGRSVINDTDAEKTIKYSFIFSTIALQHIPVRSIRNSILKDLHALLTNEGLLSFQMGFGGKQFGGFKRPGSVKYEANFTHARETNGKNDTRVEDPDSIIKDLQEIGFIDIRWFITRSWEDRHPYWIWIWASRVEIPTNTL
jgi:SAM-dependent methyltransferase